MIDKIRKIIASACLMHHDTGEASNDMEARRIIVALDEYGFEIVKKTDKSKPNKVVKESSSITYPKIIFPSVEEMNCPTCKCVTGHSIKDSKWCCVNCDTAL